MLEKITHKQSVMRLYRQAQKTCLYWAVDRQLWYKEGAKIRQEFESNMKVTDAAKAAALLRRGQEKLASMAHPDPYIVPYAPGGSLYHRNPPLPKIEMQMNFGREPGTF